MTGQPLPTGELIFDPRGVVDVEERQLAPRIISATGARLGVLDNTKWNAGKLLRQTATLLDNELAFRTINYYHKESFSRNATPELLDRIAAENEVVLIAIGD